MENPKGLEKFRATDHEECGLLIERDGETYLVKVPNRAEQPSEYAIILSDVNNVQSVLTDDEIIVGFFHTHLPRHSINPSDADLDGAENFPGMNNLIYKPNTGELKWYGVVEEVAPTTT